MLSLYIQTGIMMIWISMGVLIKKQNIISDKTESFFSKTMINITIPCAIISSFINTTIQIPAGTILSALVSICVSFFLLSILGKLSGLLVCRTASEKSVWEYMVLFTNNIYIGFPVIRHCLGAEGLIYATLICIPCNALMFSYGLYLTSQGSSFRISLKNIFNASTLASLISLFLLLHPVNCPKIVQIPLSTVGNLSTPLGLVLLGFIFAQYFEISKIKPTRVIYFCVVRLLVTAFVVKIGYQLFWSQHVLMMQVMMLTAALPTTSMSVILCKDYDNPALDMAIEGVAISTVVFLFVAPLIQMILL